MGGTRLYPDSGLNSGRCHAHGPGGKLNTHLDDSIPPETEKQQKLNIIIYLNPRWNEEWGRSVGIWGTESPTEPRKLTTSIGCYFNHAVIFNTTQNSWYSLPEPISSPNGGIRKILAAYSLCKPLENVENHG